MAQPSSPSKKRGFESFSPPDSLITIDPGTKNFYLSWIFKGKLKGTQHIPNALIDLPSGILSRGMAPFCKTFRQVLDVTKPDLIFVERFIVRGFGTHLTEKMGILIGAMYTCAISYRPPIEYVIETSTTWKTALKKIGDYDKLVKLCKERKIPQHVVDTVLTARFVLSGFTYNPESDKSWIIEQLSSKQVYDEILGDKK